MIGRGDYYRRLISGLFAAVLVLAMSEVYAGPKFWPVQQGHVLDDETGAPLAGVFVIARYSGSVPIHGSSCYHAAGTTTSERGEYRLPSRFDLFDLLLEKRLRLDFYKSGYRQVFYKDGVAKLKKDTGSRVERLSELERIVRTSGCDGAGESQRSLYDHDKGVFEEAKALSETKDELEHLEWFRWVAASNAIASDREKNMGGTEYERLIQEYLKSHLQ